MKILIHGRAFPVAMWRFFDWAFRDLGHEVFSVGNYSGGKIPWGDQYDFPQYADAPDYQIPEIDYPIDALLKEISFNPDVIVQAADTISLTGKAPCKNVILKTDSHAVDYTLREKYADHVFNMQHYYMKEGETWIPYAYYPGLHKYIKLYQKYDVVFSGLQYEQRKKALEAMQKAGLKVLNTLGLIYDEYVEVYNQGKIAFNWSSKEDLPARFWEGLAMRRLVLTNRVPDLKLLDFKDDIDYIGFDTVDEAVEKAVYYSCHPKEREAIAYRGWKKVKEHTYHKRAEEMLSIIEKL